MIIGWRTLSGLIAIIVATWLPTIAVAEDERSAQSTTPEQNLLQRCFQPSELIARAGENRIVRIKAARNTGPQSSFSTHTDATAPTAPALRGAIRRVNLAPDAGKLIALTIDLCETARDVTGYDGAIFDLLRKEGIDATVFAGGKWMRSHVERTRQLIVDPAFEMASHGELHRNLRILTGRDAHDEIRAPQSAYSAARASLDNLQCTRDGTLDLTTRPQAMRLFRFPFGACSRASLNQVAEAGMLAIQWSFSTGDPDKRTTAAIMARNMLRGIRAGDIIIAHGNGRGWHTAKALAIAIPKLKAAGFRFVTVSELLSAGTPEIASTCYSVTPGDTDRYGPFKRRPMTPSVATRRPHLKQPKGVHRSAKRRPRSTRAKSITKRQPSSVPIMTLKTSYER